MAALLLLAVSCKKDKEQQIDGSGFGFRATVESHEGDSKTHLDGKAVKWDSNDEILVQSHTCAAGKRFAFVQIEEGGEAGFNPAETLPENFYSPNYTAVYPAGDFTFGESINIELPSTQTYVENSFGNGANPMIAACGDNKKLAFKNICGLLKLQLKSETACTITSIELTSNADEEAAEKLCGTGTVNWNDGEPTLNLTSGSNSLTLNCGGVEMEAGVTTNFYFVVPAGTLAGGFTVKVTNEKGWTWEQVAPANENNGIQRNHITAMPVIEMSFLPDGALPGLFSVALGKQVRFSKGNLVATVGIDGKPTAWKFAAHQYEYLGEGGANFKIGSAAGDVDLFAWSTDNVNSNWGVYCVGANYKGYFNDWGKLEVFHDDYGTWRTLTGKDDAEEWLYLLTKRTVAKRFAKAKVNGIQCIMVFPDVFTWPTDVTPEPSYNNSNPTNCPEYNSVSYTALEKAGVVFLPYAGMRMLKTMGSGEAEYNNGGFSFWSSTPSSTGGDSDQAYYLGINTSTSPASFKYPTAHIRYGLPVRLVYEEKSSSK